MYFFFELIVTEASGSIPAGFIYQSWFSKLNLIAVKLVQEETLVDLLWFYHDAPAITLYCFLVSILQKNYGVPKKNSLNN